MTRPPCCGLRSPGGCGDKRRAGIVDRVRFPNLGFFIEGENQLTESAGPSGLYRSVHIPQGTPNALTAAWISNFLRFCNQTFAR